MGKISISRQNIVDSQRKEVVSVSPSSHMEIQDFLSFISLKKGELPTKMKMKMDNQRLKALQPIYGSTTSRAGSLASTHSSPHQQTTLSIV